MSVTVRCRVARGKGRWRPGRLPLPPEALGAAWDWWARYEAAVNHAYDEFPLWSMCAYDERTTPPAALADVARTHPRTARPGERHEPNDAYGDPEAFLLTPRPPAPDPLQLAPPVVDLTGRPLRRPATRCGPPPTGGCRPPRSGTSSSR